MPDEEQIRVVLADDHSVLRLGLRQLLERDGHVEVVGEADTGEQAVTRTRESHPNVVVMDVRMPNKDGIEATREIKAELPDTEIVVLSAFDDDDEILRALDAGAAGYLIKGDEPYSLVRAIRNASAGKLYLGPSIAKRILERLSRESSPEHPSRNARGELTARETMVLRYMGQGMKNREIASLLGISERTVGNHIANIFTKLHVQDRAQAILYGVRKGIIQV